jgi:hypothetical protein
MTGVERPGPGGDDLPAGLEHPRGTLAITIGFAVLFLVGWLAVFVFIFLGRGAPRP